MKNFFRSFLIYISLIILSQLIVLPLYPSDIPVLALMPALGIFACYEILSKTSGKQSWRRAAGIISIALLMIAGIAILRKSGTPFGPLCVALSALFFLYLYLIRSRISILTNVIILSVLLGAGYIILQAQAGFGDYHFDLAASLILIFSATCFYTTESGGIEEDQRLSLPVPVMRLFPGEISGRVEMMMLVILALDVALCFSIRQEVWEKKREAPTLGKELEEIQVLRQKSSTIDEDLKKTEEEMSRINRGVDLENAFAGLKKYIEESGFTIANAAKESAEPSYLYKITSCTNWSCSRVKIDIAMSGLLDHVWPVLEYWPENGPGFWTLHRADSLTFYCYPGERSILY